MESIKANFELSDYIAIVSLLIAILAFYTSRKSAKLNSYNQRGAYEVLLLERKLNTNKSFEVKIFNSIMSKTLPFDYKLIVHSQIGGIYKAMKFDILGEKSFVGIAKTLPRINKTMLVFHPFKRYAYNTNIHFKSTPLFPYATAKNIDNDSENKLMLNRYHFYLEITDYCNNTEIWYISFSLLLSTDKEFNLYWKQCHDCYGYKYYAYDDICVVSPKDIIRNLDRIMDFDKNLKDIIDCYEHTNDSKSLMNDRYEKLISELQLYEMKEYHKFIKRLKDEKIIRNS